MKKNKKLSLIAMLVLSICLGVFLFSGCNGDKKEKKPGSVQIEVYNTNIEGKMAISNHYQMGYDGKPKVFEIKVYSIKKKRYLTNNDVVRKDLNSLIVVTVRKNEQTNSVRIDINDPNSWPTAVGRYEIDINFNSFFVKDEDLDPNYYGAPAVYFTLFIEEEVKNV